MLPPEDTGGVFLAAVELAPEDPLPGGQYVLLVNGNDETVEVACWVIHSAATGVSGAIVVDTALPPGAGLRLLPETSVFSSRDTVTLLDDAGREADRTPQLSDDSGDDQLWFLDPSGAWAFGRQLSFPDEVSDGRLVVDPDTC